MTEPELLPNGPWNDEPNRELWRDEATGLDCLVRRGPSGALCGYVAVPPSHPYYGSPYYVWDEDSEAPREHGINAISVHGGLTYAAPCDGDKEDGICHIPQPGEPDEVWWFGFDCAHGGDLIPSRGFMASGQYRDIEYVRGEIRSLARQLAEVAS